MIRMDNTTGDTGGLGTVCRSKLQGVSTGVRRVCRDML